MKKKYSAIFFMMILAVFLLVGCGDKDAAQSAESDEVVSSIESGDPIEFSATDLDGNTVTSEFFSKSKLTMVNVWATYCNPCISEMPALGQIAGSYDASEFQLIGIVSDIVEGDDTSIVSDIIANTKASYPQLLLNESLYNSMLSGVNVVPTTIFVNREGKAVKVEVGAKEKEDWEQIINELLEEM